MPPGKDAVPPQQVMSIPTTLDSPHLFAQRGPSAVKKRLFRTPATHKKTHPRTENSPASTPSLLQGSITKRHFHPKLPPTTPLSTRYFPNPGASALRERPSVARLHTTPGMRRKYITLTPVMWRAMQAEDLTAWLNSIFVDGALDAGLSGERIAESVVFRNQVKSMCDLYKDADVRKVLDKVDAEVLSGRFFVSRKMSLATHFQAREQMIELLLLNYHPMWLLVALCCVLSCNFGVELDSAFEQLDASSMNVDRDRVIMSVLEIILQGRLLADGGVRVDVPSSGGRRLSIKSRDRDHYNGVVLRRVLHLVFLLDRAKQSRTPILPTDPSLFRITSPISSSQEIIEQLGREFLPDHGDVLRFLTFRGYRLTYHTPLFERGSLVVDNLEKDLCDGFRLCKLASMLVKDRTILSKIRRVKNGMSRKDIYTCHLGNVSLAMSKMEEYANSHMDNPFEWKVIQQDIVNGNLDKTISMLWQISSLWLQVNVLNTESLENELNIVQNEFRQSKRQSQVSVWSPGGTATIPDLNHRVVSPSRLMIYENCATKSGHLLLKWCATVAGMYGIAVRDFTESFRDGAPLCVILHHYCPELMKAADFTRVQQAELRSVNDSEAEAEIVQKNFDLFTSRVRLFGTVPHIPIRAEAALAPPFTHGEKDASFGRIMELLSSYLFKRLTLEREGQNGVFVTENFMLQKRLPEEGFHLAQKAGVRDVGLSRARGVSFAEEANPVMSGVDQTSLNANKSLQTKNISTQSAPQRESEASSPRSSYIEANLEKRSSDEDEEEGSSGSSHYDDAIDADHLYQTRGTERLFSARRTKAAKVILQHYREAKCRRAYRRRREAAISIQAGLRGYRTRTKAALLSQLQPALTSRVALADSSLNAFSPGFVSANSSPMPPPSVKNTPISRRNLIPIHGSQKLLDQTATLLPMLEAHMNEINAFAIRMVSYERNQAAISIQRSVRAYSATSAAISTTLQRSGRDSSSNSWLKLTSGVFTIARGIAGKVIAEAEVQRKASITILVNAMQIAEQAYESEMRRSWTQASHTEEKHRECQHKNLNMLRLFSEEDNRDSLTLQAEVQSLSNQVTSLEERLIEKENFDYPGDRGTAKQAEAEIIPSGNLIIPSYLPVFPSSCDNLEKAHEECSLPEVLSLEKEIGELRVREKTLIKEMATADEEYTADLEKRGRELQKWKEMSLRAQHCLAEHAYKSHMRALSDAHSHSSKERLVVIENLANLDKEEMEMRITEASDYSVLDSGIVVAEGQSMEAENYMVEKTGRTLENISVALELFQYLREAEDRKRAGDTVWSILEASFSAEVNSSVRVFEEFKAVRSDEVQTEKRSEQISALVAEEILMRKNYDENLTALDKDRSRLDDIMEEGGSYLRSLTTPVRNPGAYSTMATPRVERSAMKVSPTVELKPLEDLSSNMGAALNSIESQKILNLETDLDEVMEEGGSYLRSLTTPVRNPNACSIMATPHAKRSTMKVSPTVELKPLEDLSNNMGAALNSIESQKISNLETDLDEVMEEGGSYLRSLTTPVRNPGAYSTMATPRVERSAMKVSPTVELKPLEDLSSNMGAALNSIESQKILNLETDLDEVMEEGGSYLRSLTTPVRNPNACSIMATPHAKRSTMKVSPTVELKPLEDLSNNMGAALNSIESQKISNLETDLDEVMEEGGSYLRSLTTPVRNPGAYSTMATPRVERSAMKVSPTVELKPLEDLSNNMGAALNSIESQKILNLETDLDEVMEEGGSYLRSLTTPVRNPGAYSTMATPRVERSAMKVSPTVELKPLEDLSSNMGAALNSIESQKILNLETDLDEVMEEGGSYLRSLTTPVRNPNACSIMATPHAKRSTMKVSPTVELKPLEDLSNNMGAALNSIESQKISNLETDLDEVMEEGGSYLRSLTTPVRNPGAYSTMATPRVERSAMKVSPTVELKPLEDLSSNMGAALNSIESQKILNLETDLDEVMEEGRLYLRSLTTPVRNPNACSIMATPHAKRSTMKVSPTVELKPLEDLSNSMGTALTSIESQKIMNLENELDESLLPFTAELKSDGATESPSPVAVPSSAIRPHSSSEILVAMEFKKLDRAPAFTGVGLEVNGDIENTEEVSSPNTNTTLLGSPIALISSPNGLESPDAKTPAISQESASGSYSHLGIRADSETHRSIADNPLSLSGESKVSTWTQQAMRGSPLPSENSPQIIDNVGYPTIRSSLRSSHNPGLFSSIENQSNQTHVGPEEMFKNAILESSNAPEEKWRSHRGSRRTTSSHGGIPSGNQDTALVSVRSELFKHDTLLGTPRKISELVASPDMKSSNGESYSELELPVYVTTDFQHASPRESSVLDVEPGIPRLERRDQGSSLWRPLHVSVRSSPESGSARRRPLSPIVFQRRDNENIISNSTLSIQSQLMSSFLRSNAFMSLEKPTVTEEGLTHEAALSVKREAQWRTESGERSSGLRGLYTELNDVHDDISRRGSIQDLVKDSADAEPIGSVLRRISALSTPAKAETACLKVFDAEEEFSVLNIIGMICIIIRQCDRSEGHIQLVELGTSIIRDMCVDENRIDNVFLVEDCVSVLVTCVQFYRDHEKIIETALEALLALSSYTYGQALLATHDGYLRRLRGVNNIIRLQLQRHSKSNDRMRKADVILKAIENRRQNRAGGLFSEELEKASRAVPCIEPAMPRSAELLQHLLCHFPSF